MDKIDHMILNELNKNGRLSASEIAKRVNLSVPAVSERIRKLEDSGTIEQYTIKINKKVVNHKLMAFIFVTIDTVPNTDKFREIIIDFPEVLECHHIVGDHDYLLKVLMKDTDELEHFISKKLKRITGVQRSSTLINLSTLKSELNRMEDL